jgi:hypothetical protein
MENVKHVKGEIYMSKMKEMRREQQQSKSFMEQYGLILGGIGVLAIIGVIAVVLAPTGGASTPEDTTLSELGTVHWHATPVIELCGEEKAIPVAPIIDHLLHTHEDRLIHIEGAIPNAAAISLGKFFDNINVKFSETEIFDKTNGDVCANTGQAGNVSMTVNGQASTAFREYSPRDGDVIKIVFG